MEHRTILNLKSFTEWTPESSPQVIHIEVHVKNGEIIIPQVLQSRSSVALHKLKTKILKAQLL